MRNFTNQQILDMISSRVTELEKEISDLEDQVNDLESDLDDANDTISDLENDLEAKGE